MKKFFVLFGTLVAAATFAAATPSACVQETLDNYLANGFSCSVGNLVFSNFNYSGTGQPQGETVAASAIDVVPITLTLDGGLNFTAAWSVLSHNGIVTQDSRINFTVSTLNGAATIDDLGLGFDGSASGTGLAQVIEQYCAGSSSLVNCANGGTDTVSTTPPVSTAPDVVFSHPVSILAVSKDISAASGLWGTATISDVYNTYSQVSGVPEPMTMSLIGSGLLGLGLLRRRS